MSRVRFGTYNFWDWISYRFATKIILKQSSDFYYQAVERKIGRTEDKDRLFDHRRNI
jgi:hypothetical protein